MRAIPVQTRRAPASPVDEEACALGKQKAPDAPLPIRPQAYVPPPQPQNLDPFSVRTLGFEQALRDHKVACVYDWSGAGPDHLYVPLVIDQTTLSVYISATGGRRPAFSIQVPMGRCKPGAPRDHIVCEGLVEVNRNVLFGSFYRNYTNGEIGYRLVHPLVMAGSSKRSVDEDRVASFWQDFETAVETVRGWLPLLDDLQFASQYSAKDILTNFHLNRMPPHARAAAVARMRAEQASQARQAQWQQQQQQQHYHQQQQQQQQQQQAHVPTDWDTDPEYNEMAAQLAEL